ncbi:MAG: helix-hairpin-helix domain-containing protein [Saprospiraceae bacterium]|nr:helix-hairpin-helix domain-containing protein [Lewinella sp.]
MSNNNTDFWYFSRRERNATIALLVAVIVLFLIPAAFHFMPDEPTKAELQEFRLAVQAFEASRKEYTAPVAVLFDFDPNTANKEELLRLGIPIATVTTMLKYRDKVGRFEQADDLRRIYNLDSIDYLRIRPYIKIKPVVVAVANSAIRSTTPAPIRPFDPNTAEAEILLAAGLPEKVVHNIRKYREKGGQFRRVEDLQKIYGLSQADFEQIKPYVQINATPTVALSVTPPDTANTESRSISRPSAITLDINRAAAEEWQQFYGIGPVLSGRIVKFRDLLGGFHSIEQVAETYGLPDSTFQAIRSHLRITPAHKTLSINKIDENNLKSHPYIKWQQARVIVAYRKEHGPFHDVSDLKQVLALDENFIDRITPYLDFDY